MLYPHSLLHLYMFNFDEDKQMIYLLQEIYLISDIEIFECLTHTKVSYR